jgi:hypothetical protein
MRDEPGAPKPSPASIEEYAGGDIKVRRGRVNAWLLVVYAVLAVWAAYYLFKYWGGLGPGLGPGD